MSYPFEDSYAKFKDCVMSLSDLVYSDNPFDPNFQNRLPIGKVYSFDKIKERVCDEYRTQKLCSADAFLIDEKDSKP